MNRHEEFLRQSATLCTTQTSDNNICLAKLSSPVESSDYISPVCLAAENSTFPNGTFSWIPGLFNGEQAVIFSLFISFLKVLSKPDQPPFLSHFNQKVLGNSQSFSFKSWEITIVKITFLKPSLPTRCVPETANRQCPHVWLLLSLLLLFLFIYTRFNVFMCLFTVYHRNSTTDPQ